MVLGLSLVLSILCLSLLFFLGLKLFNQALLNYEEHFKGTAQRTMAEVFLFFDPLQLWTASLFICMCVAIFVWLFSQNFLLCLGVASVFLFLPPLLFQYLKKRRLKQFTYQLPLMLSSLSAALKTGAGVQTALKMVIQEAPSPLAQEFALVLREQRLGLSFDQALNNLLLRVPSEATQLVVSSLHISSQTGGNLAQALERVAYTLRSVAQIEGKIQALTSQGKFQAKVMVCLPLVLLLAMNMVDSDVFPLFWERKEGWLVIAVIVILELCGLYFIQKIINIDV